MSIYNSLIGKVVRSKLEIKDMRTWKVLFEYPDVLIDRLKYTPDFPDQPFLHGIYQTGPKMGEGCFLDIDDIFAW